MNADAVHRGSEKPAAMGTRGVSVVYPGGHRALEDVTIEFRRAELTVLLGRSGAGKSTLLRCLNLLQAPTAGTVWADGIGTLDSRERIRRQRRQAGMVFQLHHLIGRLSALQNVLVGRVAYHSALRSLFPLPNAEVAVAMECLERVGLEAKALKRVDQLSGGERQRVGIARTLAQRPRIMLADEPVASLDPATAESIMELLSRVAREDHLTVVFSMHQLELASRFGDRVVGIANGAIVFDGTPAELTAAPLERIYNGSTGSGVPPVAAPRPSAAPCPPLPVAACESCSAFAGFSQVLHLDPFEQSAAAASRPAGCPIH